MVLVVGEMLFDIFLEYRRLGGAPFNFAYYLKKLGRYTRFISRIGRNEPGREISDYICSIEGAVPVDDDIYKNNLTMGGGLDAV